MTEYELLMDQAKELFKAFPELEFKTIAALTLIIGWLLTAGNAQQFILNHPLVSRWGTGLAMGSFAVMQCIYLWGHDRKINKIHHRLSSLTGELNYSYIVTDAYKVSGFLPVSYAFINIIFCIAIYVLVHVISQA